MFQTAELGQKVSKIKFDEIAKNLRSQLLDVQQELRSADFPVIVVFAGVDGAGKSESVNLINEWMDPHWIVTRAYDAPSEEERERPPFWRFWRDLPPEGKIGLFQSCWYSKPLIDHVYGRIDTAQLDAELARIAAFEKTLADDGALILKFWMHLGRDAQKKRLKSLERDPLQSWRISKADWRNWKHYDDFISTAERVLQRTESGQAHWTIVEGQDVQFRSLAVLSTLRDTITDHLERRRRRAATVAAARAERAESLETKKTRTGQRKAPAAAIVHVSHPVLEAELTADGHMLPKTILDSLDMTLTLDRPDYELALKQTRAELALLCRKARQKGLSTIVAFEGVDAAGKGGAIRRLTSGIDARNYQVIPIAAPSDEERAQHYLWRFWRHLSRAGRVTIFDRSWYGRVLVERVEEFATPDEWRRAYAEINDFEEQLVEKDILLVKFWLHVDKDEQYRRFKERETVSFKQWKLTDEDWRNRAKWDAYAIAVHEMVEHTSTLQAPWTLVEGNDKNFARIKVMQTVCTKLREKLKEAN